MIGRSTSYPVFAMKTSPVERSETQRTAPSGSDQTGQSWTQIGTGIGSIFSANQHGAGQRNVSPDTVRWWLCSNNALEGFSMLKSMVIYRFREASGY